jgi:hypothetical protein
MQEVLDGIYTALLQAMTASGFPDSGNSQPLAAENLLDPWFSRGGL